MSPIEIGAELAQADELAAKATSKLAMEAGRREHCLLRLVLTANLIDDLDSQIESLQLRSMLPQTASKGARWADMISEELEALQQEEKEISDDNDDDCSDAGSEGDNEPDEATTPPFADRGLSVYLEDETCPKGQCKDCRCGCMLEVTEASELALKRFPSASLVSVVITEVVDDSEVSRPEESLVDLT